MITKTCTKCGETKPLDWFNKDRRRKDSRRSQCKSCEAEYKRQHKAENRDKMAEYQRRYYEKNRDKLAEKDRRYREENRGKIAEYQRRYREENRHKIVERKRRYTEEHREFINAEAANRMRETRESARMFVTVPPRTRFSPEEDAYLMEDNGMTTYQKAVHLGRPFDSCEVRIRRLRKKLKA